MCKRGKHIRIAGDSLLAVSLLRNVSKLNLPDRDRNRSEFFCLLLLKVWFQQGIVLGRQFPPGRKSSLGKLSSQQSLHHCKYHQRSLLVRMRHSFNQQGIRKRSLFLKDN